MRNVSKVGFVCIAVCGLGLITTPARASDVDWSTNINPLIFSDGAYHNVISRSFTTDDDDNEEVVISYFAECSVESNDRITWVDYDILLDGAPVPPTNSDNALCTGIPPDSNLASRNQGQSVGTTVARTVRAGRHNVVVRVRLVNFGAGERYRIDDQSLVVLED